MEEIKNSTSSLLIYQDSSVIYTYENPIPGYYISMTNSNDSQYIHCDNKECFYFTPELTSCQDNIGNLILNMENINSSGKYFNCTDGKCNSKDKKKLIEEKTESDKNKNSIY